MHGWRGAPVDALHAVCAVLALAQAHFGAHSPRMFMPKRLYNTCKNTSFQQQAILVAGQGLQLSRIIAVIALLLQLCFPVPQCLILMPDFA